MNDAHQLASAMLAIAFAALMLVAGQLFIEYRSTKHLLTTVLQSCRVIGSRCHNGTVSLFHFFPKIIWLAQQ
jgi:hypothetical protein